VRRLYPPPAADVTDADLSASYAFPAQGSWVRANMVATLDGAIRGRDGSSRSISTPADQRVFSLARREADVILVGAGTIRAEDYRPSLRTVAVVTGRLDLPLTLRMFAERGPEHARPIVITTAESARAAPDGLRAAADVLACGSGRVDLQEAVAALAARGLVRVHCEGGPALLSGMISAGLLDELLLTLVPTLLGGGPGEHIIDVPGGLDPALRLVPTEILEEDGTVLWRARRPAC
jgi:riboflavin biosynthesis pyrimidine reductase